MGRPASKMVRVGWLCSLLALQASCFQLVHQRRSSRLLPSNARAEEGRRAVVLNSKSDPNDDTMQEGGVEEYRNAVTKVLSNFMQKPEEGETEDPFADIDFAAPKIAPTTSLETLAAALDYELIEKEWFVTGNVNPIYFAESFEFQDPDVQVKGIEDYARGVYKLFDQETSRAEIVSTTVTTSPFSDDDKPPTITCTWRLSGKVKIGGGVTIKPYIVYTDFAVDALTKQITFQEDRFDIPAWDILLSAFFPFLIGKVTKPPAAAVPKRKVAMPRIALEGGGSAKSPVDGIASFFNRST